LTYPKQTVIDDGPNGKLVQDSLFDEPAKAHHSHPTTSKEAAKIVNVGAARRRILAILARPENKEGLTTLEMAHCLERQRDTISSHMTRLEEAGYVTRNGTRDRKIVWKWTGVEWPDWGATDVEWEQVSEHNALQQKSIGIIEDAMTRRGYRKLSTFRQDVKYPPNTQQHWTLWLHPSMPHIVTTMVNALGHRCYFRGEDTGTRLWEQY
jgi:DNA-binding transcriptional ArsR family regulator